VVRCSGHERTNLATQQPLHLPHALSSLRPVAYDLPMGDSMDSSGAVRSAGPDLKHGGAPLTVHQHWICGMVSVADRQRLHGGMLDAYTVGRHGRWAQSIGTARRPVSSAGHSAFRQAVIHSCMCMNRPVIVGANSEYSAFS
jgi:hypothetical protein